MRARFAFGHRRHGQNHHHASRERCAGEQRFAGRIVRVAYTGGAASNMGSGSRTIVSLLRLGSRNAFFGQLAPLSEGDMS